ncbi:hypothetical protein V6N13_114208 [Hibiscus sabdariffa]|uniref:Uncharacterized protein n=1 Tax=Hibiscus sabdariffa TaxID=183260 RepID=A0ABR2U1H2_9ROSI
MVSRLLARNTTATQTPDSNLNIGFGSTGAVRGFMSENRIEGNRIGHTCLKLCNSSNHDSNHQICAYYLSAVMTLFPGIRPIVVDTFRDMGREITVFEGVEACVTQGGLEVLEQVPASKLLVMVAHSLLILYKNINVQNYDNYMRNRDRALVSAARFVDRQGDEPCEVLINIEIARLIRTCLAPHQRLRAGILRMIIGNQNAPGALGSVMSYLAGILEWAEMDSIMLIFDTLLLPRSPVLYDRQVAVEVFNLCEAFKAIISTDHPPYFGIFSPPPPSTTRILEQSKFPILLAVAQVCGADKCGAVGQFITTTTSENGLVIELADKYLLATQRANTALIPNRIRFLTEILRGGQEQDTRNEQGVRR